MNDFDSSFDDEDLVDGLDVLARDASYEAQLEKNFEFIKKPAGSTLVNDGVWIKLIEDASLNIKDDRGRDMSKKALEYKYLKTLRQAFELAGPRDCDALDHAFSKLYEQAPWCREPLNAVWQSVRSVVSEKPWYSAKPILLHGVPGCGKSYLAKLIADAVSVPFLRINCAELTGVFEISGTERSWSSGDIGAPLRVLIENQVANPLILLDEVDKASRPHSSGGDPQNAVLALTDPTATDRWRCGFLKREIWMSEISWVMTANDINAVPAPLRDRCRIFEIHQPEGADLYQFVKSAAEGLHPDLIELLFKRAQKGDSLRAINRAISVAREIERKPLMH